MFAASESSESEASRGEGGLIDGFESDGDFATSAIQLLGHFLAPDRISPPLLATDAEDSDDEEIEDYVAMCRGPPSKDTRSGKYPIICSAHLTGTFMYNLVELHVFVIHDFIRAGILNSKIPSNGSRGCCSTRAHIHGLGHSR